MWRQHPSAQNSWNSNLSFVYQATNFEWWCSWSQARRRALCCGVGSGTQIGHRLQNPIDCRERSAAQALMILWAPALNCAVICDNVPCYHCMPDDSLNCPGLLVNHTGVTLSVFPDSLSTYPSCSDTSLCVCIYIYTHRQKLLYKYSRKMHAKNNALKLPFSSKYSMQ